MTAKNSVAALHDYGQSPWLDYIRRDLITSGELSRLIQQDGLSGMTSNPSIFEKAIATSDEYDDLLDAYSAGMSAMDLFEKISVRDAQDAADILRSVYDATNTLDGYVSLEVSPGHAFDTQGTIEEARHLWKSVDRPNLMIKVPGTAQGIPAIRQLISEGINVNVTLLFAQSMYERAALAFIEGLRDRVAAGLAIDRIASVASFFVSRIDSKVDAALNERLKTAGAEESAVLKELLGKVAIANAKQAYQRYLGLFSGADWDQLAAKGAQTQRLLWASTSTKNPQYRDVMYIEQLIGKDTINTIPPATWEAFRDHGVLAETLTADIEEADDVMDELAEIGIRIDEVTDELLREGVDQFVVALDKLLKVIETHPKPIGAINPLSLSLPDALRQVVDAMLAAWAADNTLPRIWGKDASVWTNADESKWLGWLDITENIRAMLPQIEAAAQDIRAAGFTDILLLGMGGSSLCPEVLRMTFGAVEGSPELHVLDSTDPQQVAAFERAVALPTTLFIVSSKSGGTLEPNIFKQYFFKRVSETIGADKAGSHFIAITDPGSHMEKVAQADGFRHIFYGDPSIGGRYSALSAFGMVPAALMGLDAPKFLDRAGQMVKACSASVPPAANPGAVLGAVLGVAATQFGRDKVTLIASPAVADLGAWLEQLLAESTGKQGKALIPVDGEALLEPAAYGADRIFAYIRYHGAPDAAQDAAVKALQKAGQPVVTVHLHDLYDLGAEFFRWEFATAAAGSIIGINPFDQPDVESAKIVTKRLTSEYESTGALPPMNMLYSDPQTGIKLFTDDRNAQALRAQADAASLAAYLQAFFAQIHAGDYFAINAFIQMDAENTAALQQIRADVLKSKGVATCLGFGPRFLHSTGQAYKGGPNTGVFLQVTGDDAHDLPVPEQKFSFGIVKEAQARGDFEVLASRDRRALRVHVGADTAAGLKTLAEVVKGILG